MEKLVAQYLRNEVLPINSLYPNQHAHQRLKSMILPLHHITSKAEKSLVAKQITLYVFLDVQGAFDNISFESIERAGFDMLHTQQISAVLGSALTYCG